MKRFIKYLLPVLILAMILTACTSGADNDPAEPYDFTAPPEVQVFPPGPQPFDPDFVEAYTELVSLVSDREFGRFEPLLDDDTAVSVDPRDRRGPLEFYDAWESNATFQDAPVFWPAFEKIFDLGGVYDADAKVFKAPYTVFECPEEFKDNNSDYCFILISDDVNVYEEKDTKSRVIGVAAYNVVYLDRDERGYSEKGPADLIKINTLGGVSGYIEKRHMWSMMDFRLEMHKTEDGWKIKYFVTGKEWEWMARE